jgi:hypothetical protein
VVPLQPPRRSHQVGLVLADRDPGLILSRALVEVAQRVDVSGTLDRLVHRYLPSIPLA